MSADVNYGIAYPQVRILSKLPKIVRDKQSWNFDISAFQWRAIHNSPFISPLLMEQIQNPEETFAACFPSKRRFFVDNLLYQPEDPPPKFPPAPNGQILWNLCGPTGIVTPGVITDIIKPLPSYYSKITTKDPRSRIPIPPEETPDPKLGEYIGPLWEDSFYKEQAQPDDEETISNFLKFIAGKDIPPAPLPPGAALPPLEYSCVFQHRVDDGLWWGIQSNDFIVEQNMPFWVTLEFSERPPYPTKHETKWVISLGVDSKANKDRYDLVLSLNKKPVLIDYYGVKVRKPGAGGTTGDEIVREFENESARITTTTKKIDVGIMTCGGRLIFYVNGSPLIYTRIVKTGVADNIGKLKEANIAKGKIRVYGTNMKAQVYAYPMTFARISAMAFPISDEKTIKTKDGGKKKIKIKYSAADEENKPTGFPVCILPSGSALIVKGKQYGVDCRVFYDDNAPRGFLPKDSFGLHREGKAKFISAGALPPSLVAGMPNTQFFFLLMRPENRSWLGTILQNSRAPFFFRIKGVDSEDRSAYIPGPIDVTNDLINLKENATAPDYFHIKKESTITLYNEGGRYDYLKNSQYGVDISWGWGGFKTKTFTGIIVSTNTNETPGKEIITLQCEDYNYILDNTPIANSPFYDGMVGYHVIKDLAKRAGIKDFKKNWVPNAEEYFLPSGYSFSSPKKRFNSTDMIFSCIMDIVKRFEAYIYFDAFGVMNIDKLPGGLLGYDPKDLVISQEFSSNPIAFGKIPILDQKDINIDFKSTVNTIRVISLERDTRNHIIVSTSASPLEDALLFKKIVMIDQPAYGDIDVAKAHMKELAKRMFKPIRGTSFKTVGNYSTVSPLDFITVDGIPFRLMSVSRNFDANNNDFSQDFEAKWLNG